jgi:16S rRNA (guanine527-N7)-methyltransferase
MDPARIAELLQPFLAGARLSPAQPHSISTYIDLLLRWNARINLTSVRNPEKIVTRHFGESLFAARVLFLATDRVVAGDRVARALLPATDFPPPAGMPGNSHLIDLGSGAGFPGLPIKIWDPSIRLTLIESNHKKVAFLREAVRSLALTDVNVFAGRAQDFPHEQSSDPDCTVTLRAVEGFASILPVAARLVPRVGRLALLIGESQVILARQLLPGLAWSDPLPIPLSSSRVLLIGLHQDQ